jgi:hypothetical protein
MNTAMNGFLVNPFTRTITPIEIARNSKAINQALGNHVCGNFREGLKRKSELDGLFTDDDGRFVAIQECFSVIGGGLIATPFNQPFYGKGVVLGSDANGQNSSAELTLEELEDMINWGV